MVENDQKQYIQTKKDSNCLQLAFNTGIFQKFFKVK